MWVTVYVQFGDCCKQETALTQKNRKRVSFAEFNQVIYHRQSFWKDQNRSVVWMIFAVSVKLVFKEI